MSIQPIRLFGDPVLRTAAIEVVDFDKELRTLVAGPHRHDAGRARGRAWRRRRSASGCGCSPGTSTGEVGHLVNPVLDLSEETQDGDEGCLSIPGLTIDCQPGAVGGGATASTCTASR